jgi:hypothetical protein
VTCQLLLAGFRTDNPLARYATYAVARVLQIVSVTPLHAPLLPVSSILLSLYGCTFFCSVRALLPNGSRHYCNVRSPTASKTTHSQNGVTQTQTNLAPVRAARVHCDTFFISLSLQAFVFLQVNDTASTCKIWKVTVKFTLCLITRHVMNI